MSVPAVMYSFGSIPNGMPLGNTGAPGQGTCGTCHGTFKAGTGVTVTAPTSYTPGGVAVSMTVSIPSTGGFQLAVLTQSGNSQAGTLTVSSTAPPGFSFPTDSVTTLGSIQYVADTVETTSWTFSWTPPATNVGNVVLYVTGGSFSSNFSNSYTITAPSTTPPPPPTPTLASVPTSLTFMVNGVETATQSLSITSGGSPIAVSTSISPASAAWLSVMPPGANTAFTATVAVNAVSLAAGTYNANVVLTSSGASNSPLSVPVTVNVTTPIPPSVPTLNLSSAGLNFNATAGDTAPSAQSVMVTTSSGSAVTFNAAPSTTAGGNWLTVGGSTSTSTGTTPASQSIGVVLTGLAAGTYHGSVTFSSSGVSNSPVSLPVTLTVNSSTPPPTPPPTTGGESFSLVVVDRQSGGTDWLLLDGSGSVNSNGTPSGSGLFTRFRSVSTRFGGSAAAIVSNGTWKPTSVMSYTPVSGSSTGGTLVLAVQISTHGTTTISTGTLTITNTGNSSSVTLAINGGATFMSAGIGTESITNSASGGAGGTGTGGTGTGGHTDD